MSKTAGRRVKLLEPLGKGGFGAVFLAEVRSPGGLVQRMAVKLLSAEMEQHAEIAARARDEARLMSQLNHDNVVKIYGLTQLGGRWVVLMEYVEGADADSLSRASLRTTGQPIPLGIALRLGEATAGALHAAWTTVSPQTGRPLKVVHRDIKPANLLLSRGGAVKVLDFGVARAEFDREVYTSSAQFGTARFMAPERWIYGEAGPASDVYSLGVTLWELATGLRFERPALAPAPFEEALDDRMAALRTSLGASHGAHVDALSALLRSCLAYESTDRPEAAAFEDRLSALAEGVPGNLRRYARETLPSLLEARREALRQDPDLAQLSGSVWLEGPVDEPSGPPADAAVHPRLPDAGATFALDPPTAATSPSDGPPARGRVWLWTLLLLATVVGTALVMVPQSAPEPIGQAGEPEVVVAPPAAPSATPVQVVTASEAPDDAASRRGEDPAPATQPSTTAPEVVVQAAPDLQPEVEAQPEPDVALQTVSLRVLADPTEGHLVHASGVTAVRDDVVLEAGKTHEARFEGTDWSERCELAVEPTHARIRVTKGQGCWLE